MIHFSAMSAFLNPDDTATAIVNRLLSDQALRFAEEAQAQAIAKFHNEMAGWVATAEQGQGKTGFILAPPPVPPAGYKLPPVVPPVAPPAVSGTVIMEGQGDGRYPSTQDDPNLTGAVIDNPLRPGEKVRKVAARLGPFGWSYWWEVVKP